MGTQILSKTNRLFWLGRYVERTLIEVNLMQRAYDDSIDGEVMDYRGLCERLEIPCPYEDGHTFVYGFLFDKEFPYSVISSLGNAYDNAIVLREVLSSQALSYIQMALNVMENAALGLAPMLDLQGVQDYLYAFRGCSDDSILDRHSRYTLKVGSTVERIDMYVRLGCNANTLPAEISRLWSRLQMTPLGRDGERLKVLMGLAANPDPVRNRELLIDCVEGLISDV